MSKVKQKKVDDIQQITLSITATKNLIKHQFRQVIQHGPSYHGLMFFLVADAGVGKTQLMNQVVKEMSKEISEELADELKDSPDFQFFKKEQKGEAKIVVNNLSAKDAQDFSGLPVVDQESLLQTFARPDNIPSDGYGMIFYDEANRVHDLGMKSTLLSLWMDRGVNGHYLGKGYIQIAAGNPFDNPKYETEKPDSALAERFRVINLAPTLPEVIEFLTKRYETHFLLEYFKENKDLCNLVSGDSGYSPRTIDKAMEICFSIKDQPEGNEELIRNLMHTYFDSSTTQKIINFIANIQDVTLEKIIKDPKMAKKIKTSDVPLTTTLVKDMIEICIARFEAGEDISDKENKAFMAVSEKLNAEAMMVFLNSIINYEGKIEKASIALYDYLVKQNKPLIKSLKRVEDEIAK